MPRCGLAQVATAEPWPSFHSIWNLSGLSREETRLCVAVSPCSSSPAGSPSLLTPGSPAAESASVHGALGKPQHSTTVLPGLVLSRVTDMAAVSVCVTPRSGGGGALDAAGHSSCPRERLSLLPILATGGIRAGERPQ